MCTVVEADFEPSPIPLLNSGPSPRSNPKPLSRLQTEPMRVPVIAGNWKMNLLERDSIALAQGVVQRVDRPNGVEVVLCPVATNLRAVAEAVANSGIEVGAQNCYPKENGAYTGEISPQMIQDTGAQWVIIGHSERRQYFHESDTFLNEKLHFALKSGLKVMYCIGETLAERKSGKMDDVLHTQVTKGLDKVDEASFDRLVIAYEPVWAIGTGETATPDQAQDAHHFVRNLVQNQYNARIANRLRIQYGGSVKPDNARELMQQPDVDGALVGGASLQAEGFAAIVQAAAQSR